MKQIHMLITDCDGVLTDGGMYYSEDGEEMKKFNTKDGMAFQLLHENGILTAIVTGENRELVRRRSLKMHATELRMGVTDKKSEVEKICNKYGLSFDNIAYIGDDINDLEAIRHAAISFAPEDCMEAVRKYVTYVCRKRGGEGVVREAAEILLAMKKDREDWYEE